MPTNSINDEILRIKRQLAGAFGNDIDRIVADARSRQTNVVTRQPRPYEAERSTAPEQAIADLPGDASVTAAG